MAKSDTRLWWCRHAGFLTLGPGPVGPFDEFSCVVEPRHPNDRNSGVNQDFRPWPVFFLLKRSDLYNWKLTFWDPSRWSFGWFSFWKRWWVIQVSCCFFPGCDRFSPVIPCPKFLPEFLKSPIFFGRQIPLDFSLGQKQAERDDWGEGVGRRIRKCRWVVKGIGWWRPHK